MVSRPDYNGLPVDDERRRMIMQSFHKAMESGDQNVHFIDGASLFAGDAWDACTVDGCHPNDLGFYRMAKGMLPTLRRVLFQ